MRPTEARDRAFALEADSDEGFRYGRGLVTGLWGVYRYNYATHTYGDLVYAPIGADVDTAYLAKDGKSLQVAYYTDSRPRVEWLDPAMAQLQASFDQAVAGKLSDREVSIQSRSRDNGRMIVRIGGSNDPGNYYFYQEATGRMSRLAPTNDRLKPAQLAIAHYVHYTARDGEEIPAYLTLPRGRPRQRPAADRHAPRRPIQRARRRRL